MDPWETAVYTGVIVIAGQVTQNYKGPGLKEAATGVKPKPGPGVLSLLGAAVFYALFLIGLQSIDEKLAQAMAYLVLIAAVLQYGASIMLSLGVIK